MSFDATKPAENLDCAQVDDAIRANFLAIQKGEHLTDSSEPSGKQEGYLWYDSTNNLLKAYDGSAWDTYAKGTSTGTLFGTWATKSLNTVYLAATDGIVTAFTTGALSGGGIYGFTSSSQSDVTSAASDDSSSTQRAKNYYYDADGAGSGVGITMPVKKGDYWKVNTAGTVSGTVVQWLPMGA